MTVEGCTAFGKVYHKECFKCCVCRKRIDGKFFEKNGKPYCSKDFEVTLISSNLTEAKLGCQRD